MSKMHPGIKALSSDNSHPAYLWDLALDRTAFDRQGLNVLEILEKLFPKHKNTTKRFRSPEGYHELNSDKIDLKREFIEWFLTCIYSIRNYKEKKQMLWSAKKGWTQSHS